MQRVPYGMIGGGHGSWIGDAHRRAARAGGEMYLAAGCFSSSAERSRAFAAEHLPGVDPARAYGGVEELIAGERARPEGERVRFVVVCTPNKAHAPQCLALLRAGFHVVCDKPLTETLEDAGRVRAAARESGRLLALTHCYTGYAMVKEARALVRAGRLGALRKVLVEYPQGWLAAPTGAGAGMSSTKGGVTSLVDVGTHAEHLARYVTGLEIEELVADVNTFVGGARAPDDYSVLLRYRGGARGVMIASQVLTGEHQQLRLRVYGEDASLEWCQETPNDLVLRLRDAPVQRLERGCPYLSRDALHRDVNKPGLPTGYIDALAAVYNRFAAAVLATDAGQEPDALDLDFPTADDGVQGIRFVDAVEASGASGKWTALPADP